MRNFTALKYFDCARELVIRKLNSGTKGRYSIKNNRVFGARVNLENKCVKDPLVITKTKKEESQEDSH